MSHFGDIKGSLLVLKMGLEVVSPSGVPEENPYHDTRSSREVMLVFIPTPMLANIFPLLAPTYLNTIMVVSSIDALPFSSV